jgi:hypothetical protein
VGQTDAGPENNGIRLPPNGDHARSVPLGHGYNDYVALAVGHEPNLMNCQFDLGVLMDLRFFGPMDCG